MRLTINLLIIIFTILLLASCSYRPIFSESPGSYGYQEYQECIDKNPDDKTKCDLIRPDSMEPNITEHKYKEGYH